MLYDGSRYSLCSFCYFLLNSIVTWSFLPLAYSVGAFDVFLANNQSERRENKSFEEFEDGGEEIGPFNRSRFSPSLCPFILRPEKHIVLTVDSLQTGKHFLQLQSCCRQANQCWSCSQDFYGSSQLGFFFFSVQTSEKNHLIV